VRSKSKRPHATCEKQMTAAVAYLVANQLSGPALSLTISKLGDLIISLGAQRDDVVQRAHHEISRIVPFVKLKIVHAMVADFEALRRRSKTVDAIMDSLNESANEIHRNLTLIKVAAVEYESCWFRRWRPHLFNVEIELDRIRAASLMLDRGFQLLTDLLPSCVSVFCGTNLSRSFMATVSRGSSKSVDARDTSRSSTGPTLLSIEAPMLSDGLQIESHDPYANVPAPTFPSPPSAASISPIAPLSLSLAIPSAPSLSPCTPPCSDLDASLVLIDSGHKTKRD
jgi:hypothetical protein